MKLFLFTTLLSLVLNVRMAAAFGNLMKDLLREYPSSPNCDLQFVTDQSSKLDSLFSTTEDPEMNIRAVTMWKLSAKQHGFPNMAVSLRGLAKCEMVFVDADQLLTTDFIKHIHSRGHLGRTHFYAIKLESVQILHEMNVTEIYDFSHLIFFVDKVTRILSSFNLIKKSCEHQILRPTSPGCRYSRNLLIKLKRERNIRFNKLFQG